MGKGHFRQGEFGIGPLIHLFGKSIGPTNHKTKPLRPAAHLFLQPRCKLNGAHLDPMLIEQHDTIALREATHQHLALLSFLTLGRNGPPVLQIRQNDKGNLRIEIQPFDIVVEQSGDLRRIGLPDYDQIDIHRRVLFVLEVVAAEPFKYLAASTVSGNGKSLFHSPCTSR